MQIVTLNRPPCSQFWFLIKLVSLKVVHPLKIYQHTKFHGRVLTGMVEAMELKIMASRSPSMA
jgi:hypothetical protein